MPTNGQVQLRGACACVRPLPLKLEPSAPSPEAIHLQRCCILIQLALRYRRSKSTRRTTTRALPSQCATVRPWSKFCASVGQASLKTGSPHAFDSCQWHITTPPVGFRRWSVAPGIPARLTFSKRDTPLAQLPAKLIKTSPWRTSSVAMWIGRRRRSVRKATRGGFPFQE